MAHADFVHLRVHTAYSLSEGAIKIGRLAELCRAQRMPAVAMTDTGNMFGAMEFSIACAGAGVQPVIGCQLVVAERDEVRVLGNGVPNGRRSAYDSLVLLAVDEAGYRNLMKLVSASYLETQPGEPPQVTLEGLEAQAGGLIALTGGPTGPVGRRLYEGQTEAAEAMLLRLARAFPGRLYVELQRHGMEAEERTEPTLLDLAYQHDLPLVATNEVFFESADMYEAHDALICIAGGTYLSQADRRRLTLEHRFKSAKEMRDVFADLPEALDNTLVIAKRCTFMLGSVDPMLPKAPTAEGLGEEEALAQLARDGLERRLENHLFAPQMNGEERERVARPYRERLEYELEIIRTMGFAGYFLIVAEFIRWAKAHEIPVGPGRGSGAGSVVAWALTITDLDPLRFGLLFERFLNPERVSMPDFDIDFCVDGRDRVIRHVQEEYGVANVAQIITFGTLQARAAIRDVGRVLEMPYGQVDRISKLVPFNPAKPITLARAIEAEPVLLDMRRSDERVGKLLDIALKLEGLYRHASTHAAGVVIGNRPLDEIVPLYRDPRSDMQVTQFSMKYAEMAGLVKFDFLGLKTLTILDRAQRLIGERGTVIDLAGLALDDANTYEMLGRGESTGVFQLESSGMRDVLRRLRPDRFEDLIAIVALFRPGPMDNIPRYIACKHGEEEPDYLDPSLEEILKETFGIIVYQEQVMQIAQVLSGYTLGGADLLRRAMGKKIQSEMDAQRSTFVEGAVARGVDRARAASIFDQVNKFAGYGFNKTHAAAYAMVAYQTGYLKANYPVEFLAACMTQEISNTDKLKVFQGEADRLGIRLLAPDINRSGVWFTVEPGPDGTPAIRYALAAVRNVGRQAMESLVAEREADGPFADFADVTRRLDGRSVNKRQLENLVCVGVFDELSPNRAQLFDGIEIVLRHAAVAANERESQQASLFGENGVEEPGIVLPERPDWAPMERLQNEMEALGFYLTAHPLEAYGRALERVGAVGSAELPERLAATGARRVKLGGVVQSRKERTSQRGSRFAFVELSDTRGTYEVTVFSEVLAAARELLDSGEPLLVTVDARLEDAGVRLIAQAIERLDAAAAHAAAGLKVFIEDGISLGDLSSVIRREGKGRGRITLISRIDAEREVEIALPGGYVVSPKLAGAVKHLRGVVDVREI